MKGSRRVNSCSFVELAIIRLPIEWWYYYVRNVYLVIF